MMFGKSFLPAACSFVGAPAAAIEHKVEHVAIVTASGAVAQERLKSDPEAKYDEESGCGT
jgi:hypothetical protein